MPVKQGTFETSPIYEGADKIGKIYRGRDLVYTSYVDPVIALIERTIKSVEKELTSEAGIIGDYAFADCKGLTSIIIPSGLTYIRTYAFNGCSSLINITLPSSIVLIDAYAFNECSSLTNITLPSNVQNIYTGAFNGCSSLNEMRIEATTPPNLSEVNAISSATTTIYVPSDSVSAYQTAEIWTELTTRETNPITFVGFKEV